MGRKKGNKPQPNPDGSQPLSSQSSQQRRDTPTGTSQGSSTSESHQGTGRPRGSFSSNPQRHYQGSQGHGSGQRSDFREPRSWGTGAPSGGSHGQRSDYRRPAANRAQPGDNQYERRQHGSDFREPQSRGSGPHPDGSHGQHEDYRRPTTDRGQPSDYVPQSLGGQRMSTPQQPAASSISAWVSKTGTPPSKPAFSRKEDSASVRDEPQAKPTTSGWGVKSNIPTEKERSVSSTVAEERSKQTPLEESAFSKLPEDAPKAGRKKGKNEKGPSKKGPAGNETKVSSSKQPVSGKQKASSSKPQPATQDTTKMMENINLTEFPMPARKEKEIKHTSDYMLKSMPLEVNYLSIDIKTSNLQIYHYDVNFSPEAAKYLFRPAMVIFVNRHAPGRHPAFDGRKNLYAAGTPLPFNNVTDEVIVFDEINLRERKYEITVQLVDQELNLDGLREYLRNGNSMDQPQDTLQAMDIAIRQPLYHRGFVPCGRSFFSPPAASINLTGGLELWPGHFQSVVLGWKPYLNVDVAHKAFYKRQTILEFLNASIRNFNPMQAMTEWQRDELKKLITYKIEYQMPPDAGIRKFRVAGIGQTAKDTFQFEENGVMRQITVQEYFLRYKSYKIQYPNLPPMRTQRGDLLPLELCSILPNQPFVRKLNPNQTSEMVKNAAQPPNERKQRIVPAIRNARFNEDPCIEEFGVTIGDRFTQVEAWLLKPPKIEYANRNIAEVSNGVWKTNGRFFQNTTISNWAIINTELRQINDRDKWGLVKAFRMAGAALGINVEEPIYVGDCTLRSDRDMVNEFKEFKTMPKIVVVIMNNSDDCYGKIKRAAELNSGVLTQCLKSRTVQRMNPMTATNILLKINAKLNGTNHILWDAICPSILKKHKVMIVGADVTHPSPGVESVSIAAVAASHDIHGFKYNMTYRLQTSRMEMIYDLKDMMKEQLKRYEQSVGQLPEKILYFRDGVSEGQFAQVKHVELTAIRKACTEYGGDKYMPGTTFLVVQKRHHTRFFPPSSPQFSDKNNNVFAGTVVDQEITHPTEVDFYMVSHQSIKGTARPTKYHLLWDDNDFDLEPLEQLTYYLCHMFARCTRSVSYPAPTYYAHLAAFRGRAWWEKFRFDRALLHDADGLRRFQEQNGNVVLRNAPMFFV